MKLRPVLIVLALAIMVAGAFFIGRWSEKAPHEKRGQRSVKAAGQRAAKKAVAPTQAAKKPRIARIAIVVDDFGYNTSNVGAFLDINEPITLSILPNLPRSRDVANMAGQRGYEVILHLPLESHRKDVREEADTIKTGETNAEVVSKLAKDIESVPGLRGVSNHMGSKATEDRALMSEIFTYLKKKNLYFFDSLTSDKTVCRETAREVGLKFAKRDVFLDNVNNALKIEEKLAELEKLAVKRGFAIAICHDRKNTAAALAGKMPEMDKDGIEFVYLSELVK